jgi:ferredoxin/flavodoxin---NADP+ reductase
VAWIHGEVLARRDWADGLFTLRIAADIGPFLPGQWLNIALEIGGDLVKRPYSIASAPGLPLEVYLVRVDDGALTPMLDRLGVGDTLQVSSDPAGFFTLEHVPEARHLWLLATGTGLGPFLSMLRSGQLWTRHERVVLVHGARLSSQLGYREELEAMAETRSGFRYLPVVSRESDELALAGRIPANVDNGHLEAAAELQLNPADSHVLICGNPAMIRDTVESLGQRGLRKHRTRAPGHITTEKYW